MGAGDWHFADVAVQEGEAREALLAGESLGVLKIS